MKATTVRPSAAVLVLMLTVTMIADYNCTNSQESAAEELERLLDEDLLRASETFKNRVLDNEKYLISEAALDSLGYHLIKQNKIKEAVTVFQINVELFPNSWKAWDSLGEGFMYMNDETQCRTAYEKSLEINPDNRNASKQLRYLDEFLYGVAHETESTPRFLPGESTAINKPYFGQEPPGVTPELFAPGIASTRGNLEYSCTFSPDGREMFFCARIGKNVGRMFYSKWERDGWTFPEIPEFSRGHIDYLPYIMPDGKRVFFGRIEKDENGVVVSNGLYAMDRTDEDPFAWSEPYLFEDGEGWMHVSATQDLTVYTTYLPTRRTARFRLTDGGYPERETLEGELHPGGHPSIAPDERYIVFDSEREGGFGKADLWVSFRNPDGAWGKGINLGNKVNTPGNESIPHMSTDGQYLFYTSNRDIFWVSTEFIDGLRPSPSALISG
jgi:hypothetical protein